MNPFCYKLNWLLQKKCTGSSENLTSSPLQCYVYSYLSKNAKYVILIYVYSVLLLYYQVSYKITRYFYAYEYFILFSSIWMVLWESMNIFLSIFIFKFEWSTKLQISHKKKLDLKKQCFFQLWEGICSFHQIPYINAEKLISEKTVNCQKYFPFSLLILNYVNTIPLKLRHHSYVHICLSHSNFTSPKFQLKIAGSISDQAGIWNPNSMEGRGHHQTILSKHGWKCSKTRTLFSMENSVAQYTLKPVSKTNSTWLFVSLVYLTNLLWCIHAGDANIKLSLLSIIM